jgi:signal transduction histidine kinase/ligand-binding sensor domain-containing protein
VIPSTFLRRLATAFLFVVHLHANAAEPVTPLLSDYTHTAWGELQDAPVGVLKIAQTADGWLWVTTEKGLYRYDGVRFERMEAVYGHHLYSNDVMGMMATRDGALWVGYHIAGLSVFSREGSRTFTESDGFPSGNVADIKAAPDGAVWVATREGALRLMPGASRFERQGNGVGLPEAVVTYILFARDGTQWIASARGVFARRPGEKRFTLRWKNTAVGSLAEEPDGTVWALGANDQYYRVPGTGSAGTDMRGPEIPAVHIDFDRNGNAWILRRNAVERRRHPLDPARADQQLTRGDGLSGAFPQPFLEDREGNIWIGTLGGLDRFRRNRLVPLTVSDELIFPGMASGPDGSVWISNYAGGVHSVSAAGLNRLISKERFTASHWAPDGTFWLANDQGLKRRGRDGSMSSIPPPEGQRGRDPQAIQQDGSGALWMSVSGGGGIFRLVDGQWIKNGGLTGLPKGLTLTMAMDSEGRIWMGHQGNRISVVPGSEGPAAVRRLDAASGLQLGTVLSLCPDGKFMWAGGERGTMLYRDGRFVALHGARGERFRGMSGIVRLPGGDLWLHGADGIYHVGADALAQWMRDPGRPVDFERFDALDGLRGHAPQLRPLPSLLRAPDGTLWFSTGHAIAAVDPAHVYRNTVPPPVMIRSLEANGTPYEPPQHGTLDLPERTDRLRLAFTALSLSMPERVRFRYRLDGVDHGWQESADRRGVSYTNLAPGSYRFEVMAANEDGVWSRQPAVLDMRIRPTFVQTSWFAMLLALGAALLLYAAYALRIRYIRQRLQERHRVQLDERSRIARSLHDTLLQSVQGLLLSFNAHARHVPDGSGERARLERTLDLGWRLVEEGRDQIMNLRASASSDELRTALEAYGRHLAEHGGHAFEIRTAGGVLPLKVYVQDELQAIAREALFNASRYAKARHVVVELEYGPDTFIMRIRDDGQGLDTGVAETGYRPGHWGLLGMRERAESVDAGFVLSSEPGQGTEIMVTLSAGRAYQFSLHRQGTLLSRWLRF